MTQIIVTLDNNADEAFLRRMIENMKGVIKTTLKHSSSGQVSNGQTQFLDSLHSIKNSIDPSLIDMSNLEGYGKGR